jgi:hypothetical protein
MVLSQYGISCHTYYIHDNDERIYHVDVVYHHNFLRQGYIIPICFNSSVYNLSKEIFKTEIFSCCGKHFDIRYQWKSLLSCAEHCFDKNRKEKNKISKDRASYASTT